MAKPTMTLDEARALLNRWDDRKPGEQKLVLMADKLLAKAWEKKGPRFKKRASA
jgi:hypothetical protein